MMELFPFLDALTIQQRLVASVGSVVGLALLLLGVKRAGKLVGDRYDTYLGEAGAGLFSLLLALGTGVVLVWLWDASPVIEAAVLQVGDPYVLAARSFVTTALLVGLYVLTGVVRRAVNELAESRRSFGQHESEIVYRIAQVCIYVGGVAVALGIWKVDLSGFLIGAGFLGIVIGMAARQTLGALIAGFVLMFSRPFEIGDWVQIGDKEGIVTDITIVNTRLQSFDGEYVMLPNDMVSSNDIVNRTRKGRLRIHVEVGVDYETDLETAIEVTEDAMGDLEEILSVPQPKAVISEFSASAVTLDLRFWIDKPSARRRWRAQTAVVAAVKSAFDEHGIKIPFPQRELMGRSEAGGFHIADAPPAASADAETDRMEADEGSDADAETEAEADDD